MKMHLMIMTAMLSFFIVQNCEAQDTKRKRDETCEKAEDCQSNVCTTDKKCGVGTSEKGVACMYDSECASYNCYSGAYHEPNVPVSGLCK